jgi:hypothetical protein
VRTIELDAAPLSRKRRTHETELAHVAVSCAATSAGGAASGGGGGGGGLGSRGGSGGLGALSSPGGRRVRNNNEMWSLQQCA